MSNSRRWWEHRRILRGLLFVVGAKHKLTVINAGDSRVMLGRRDGMILDGGGLQDSGTSCPLISVLFIVVSPLASALVGTRSSSFVRYSLLPYLSVPSPQ